MNISLTRFLDFVNSNGLAKKAIVEKTMVPENYEPYKDFYKNLREAIISLHKEGASVDTLPTRVPWTNEIKKKHYNELISGYQKWCKNKKIVFLESQSYIFDLEGISLSINPELIVNINNKPTVIKLYFKQPKLEKNSADIIITLLSMAFGSYDAKYSNFDFAILDIRHSRLFRITATTPIQDLMKILPVEAASWLSYQSI